MIVERVFTESGSHVVPPLNQRWADLEKLRWRAAVVAIDDGVTVEIHPSNYSVGGRRKRGYFDAQTPSRSQGPMSFQQAWTFLNGVSFGAGLAGEGA